MRKAPLYGRLRLLLTNMVTPGDCTAGTRTSLVDFNMIQISDCHCTCVHICEVQAVHENTELILRAFYHAIDRTVILYRVRFLSQN